MAGAVVYDGRTDKKGLSDNHAYTIIGNAEYQGTKLVKIRNPWGSEGYTGPYSDKSSEWTPEARAALGSVDKDDGIFWMTISDFKDLFDSITVGYFQDWHQDKKDQWWDRVSDLSEQKISFRNPLAQRVIIGLSGYSDRMFMDNTCKDSKKVASVYFYLTKGSGHAVKEADVGKMTTSFGTGTYYSQLGGQGGQGWIIMENLPAGDYKLKLGKFSNVVIDEKGGWMPFTVQTFGQDATITVV